MKNPLVAMRFPPDVIKRLRRAAHAESLKQDKEVTWVVVLRQAAEKYLDEQEREQAQLVAH